MATAVRRLSDLVAIPSVSWPAFDQSHVRASAEAIAELARASSVFDRVGVYASAVPGTDETGQPAVLAVKDPAPGQRRVLLYAHHDVQPVGDESLWTSAPFRATERGGRLYGRGTADDKAGVLTHLTALEVLAQVVGETGLGVTLFVEGEEEYGSRSFVQFLADHRDDLAADLIVVTDSGNWDADTPGLTVSLRGNVRFTLTVRTMPHGLHSGMFGGVVPDAMMATVMTLASLWDTDGTVAVPGLLRRRTPTPAYSAEQLRADTDLPASTQVLGEDAELLNRLWNEPSITVTGIDHTSVSAASNTLSPVVSVVVSARIAPGQDAEEAYRAIHDHLVARVPFGAELTFGEVDCGRGFLASENWATDLGRQALADGYGVAPADLGEGGSIPFIADLATEFPQAAILVTAVLDPQASPHSPNESLHLATFEHAIVSEALLLARVAAMVPEPSAVG